MSTLSLQEEEIFAEQIKIFPVLYDKTKKCYKEREVVRNAWKEVAKISF